MTNLPTTLLDENQAIDIVTREGVATIEQRMAADYSRACLQAILRWQLQQGPIETLQVVACGRTAEMKSPMRRCAKSMPECATVAKSRRRH